MLTNPERQAAQKFRTKNKKGINEVTLSTLRVYEIGLVGGRDKAGLLARFRSGGRLVG